MVTKRFGALLPGTRFLMEGEYYRKTSNQSLNVFQEDTGSLKVFSPAQMVEVSEEDLAQAVANTEKILASMGG